MNPRPTLLAAALLAGTAAAQDAAETPDKSGYSLFNPTPRNLWRPLSADRPDFTESPYTVDAGALQLEMSLFDYAENGDSSTLSVAPVNLKIGLLNDVDLQLVLDPYINADDGAATDEGFGDTQVRLKLNLWGNDEDGSAFAVMPFIKFPTADDDLGNDHVEGGIIFPFAMDLAEGLGLGLMFETDFVFDDIDDGYDTEFVTTAVLGFDVTERIGAYVEGIGITSTDSDQDFQGILGLGSTYGLSERMILDAGVSIGLTGDADDFSVFSGVTIRF